MYETIWSATQIVSMQSEELEQLTKEGSSQSAQFHEIFM